MLILNFLFTLTELLNGHYKVLLWEEEYKAHFLILILNVAHLKQKKKIYQGRPITNSANINYNLFCKKHLDRKRVDVKQFHLAIITVILVHGT